jgi:hypothetical protein
MTRDKEPRERIKRLPNGTKPRIAGRPRGRPRGSYTPPTADGRPTEAVLRIVAGLDVDDVPQLNEAKAAKHGQGKNEYGLTVKQEAFCQAVAVGNTLSASYRAAYNAENMSPETVFSHASRMMARDTVKARVNMLVRERSRETTHDSARIKAKVIERLQLEAEDKKNPASVRVRALELLGKLTDVAAFRERVITEEPESSTESLTAQLEERIASLMKSA